MVQPAWRLFRLFHWSGFLQRFRHCITQTSPVRHLVRDMGGSFLAGLRRFCSRQGGPHEVTWLVAHYPHCVVHFGLSHNSVYQLWSSRALVKQFQIDKRDRSPKSYAEGGWELNGGVMKVMKRSWPRLSRDQLLFMYVDEHGLDSKPLRIGHSSCFTMLSPTAIREEAVQ